MTCPVHLRLFRTATARWRRVRIYPTVPPCTVPGGWLDRSHAVVDSSAVNIVIPNPTQPIHNIPKNR